MRVADFNAAVLLGTFLMGWFAIPPAFAEESEPTSGRSMLRRVRVSIDPAPLDAQALDGLLLEWFGSSAPHLQVGHLQISEALDVMTPSREPDLLRIWIVLQDSGLARVYFADPTGERFSLREVPLRNGLDEVGREQLAQVVVTTSLAFIEGRVTTQVDVVQRSLRSAQSKRQPAQPHPVSTAVLAPLAQRVHWYPRFGAYYSLGLEHLGVWRNGPGLSVGLARELGQRRIIIDFKFHYLWQVTVTAPDLLLSLRTLGTRLTIGYESKSAGNSVGSEMGVVLDTVNYQPHSNSSTHLSLRGPANQWRPGGYLGARVAHDFSGLRSTFLTGVTVYEPHTEYAILREGQSRTEYAPFTVQPQAALEISWR